MSLRGRNDRNNLSVFKTDCFASLAMTLAFTFLISSCINKQEKGVHISGTVTNGSNQKVYLEQFITADAAPLDSIEIDKKGKFHFETKVSEIGFYRLRFADNNFISLVVDTNSNIEITGNAKDIEKNYSIKGSEESQLLKEVNSNLQISFHEIDSLSQILQNAKEKENIKMDSLSHSLEEPYNKIISEREKFVREFINAHSNSIVALTVINYLKPESDFDLYKLSDKSLYEKYPNSQYVKDFHNKIAELSKLAVGTEAPEIILNDPDGKPIALSSLRGEIILIDFWASWCGPCRQENPNNVKLYKKFHSKGLEIYGVSLDKEKDAWLKAIKDDHLTWIHVSDLQFWNSSVVKSYNIEGIPLTYLIDKNGIIITKGLRGEELEKKITEIIH